MLIPMPQIESQQIFAEVRRPLVRVNVIGTSGSGKSTFSRKLADILRLSYVEMDKVFWRPNWVQPSDETFFADLERVLPEKGWVLDGNYTRTIPVKWRQVDLVIWLDYSFPRTLLRAIRRALHRSWTGEELWEGTGNRETFKKSFFTKESIIWWTITTHGKVRRKYEETIQSDRYPQIEFLRFRHPREADAFLKRLSDKEKSR